MCDFSDGIRENVGEKTIYAVSYDLMFLSSSKELKLSLALSLYLYQWLNADDSSQHPKNW